MTRMNARTARTTIFAALCSLAACDHRSNSDVTDPDISYTRGQILAQAAGSVEKPAVVVVDRRGNRVDYDSLTREGRQIVEQAVNDVRARDPGSQEIHCGFGPGLSVSCWGNGWICGAWIDSDGLGGFCGKPKPATPVS